MTQQEIIKLAESYGFYKNHFIRMKDKKSGVVIAGVFTKYKQNETDGLRIKNDNTEVQIITNGELNFDVLNSVEIKPKKIGKSKWIISISEYIHQKKISQRFDELFQKTHKEFGWPMDLSINEQNELIRIKEDMNKKFQIRISTHDFE